MIVFLISSLVLYIITLMLTTKLTHTSTMDAQEVLTTNITASHLLIHLISGATLALTYISLTAASITFIILILLTILEFAVALIQAYVFTLLVSLYLNENT